MKSLDAAVVEIVRAELAASRAPSVDWVLAETLGYGDRRAVKRDATELGFKYSAIGVRTYVHLPSWHAALEKHAIDPKSIADRDAKPENDADDELARAFGVVRAAVAGGSRR